MILVGVSESDSEVDSLNRGRLAGVVVSASRGVGECSRTGLGTWLSEELHVLMSCYPYEYLRYQEMNRHHFCRR